MLHARAEGSRASVPRAAGPEFARPPCRRRASAFRNRRPRRPLARRPRGWSCSRSPASRPTASRYRQSMNPCRHGPAVSLRVRRPGQEKLQFPVDLDRRGHACARGEASNRSIHSIGSSSARRCRRRCRRRCKVSRGMTMDQAATSPGRANRSWPARRGPACPARADPASRAADGPPSPSAWPPRHRRWRAAAARRENEYCRRPAGSAGTGDQASRRAPPPQPAISRAFFNQPLEIVPRILSSDFGLTGGSANVTLHPSPGTSALRSRARRPVTGSYRRQSNSVHGPRVDPRRQARPTGSGSRPPASWPRRAAASIRPSPRRARLA